MKRLEQNKLSLLHFYLYTFHMQVRRSGLEQNSKAGRGARLIRHQGFRVSERMLPGNVVGGAAVDRVAGGAHVLYADGAGGAVGVAPDPGIRVVDAEHLVQLHVGTEGSQTSGDTRLMQLVLPLKR